MKFITDKTATATATATVTATATLVAFCAALTQFYMFSVAAENAERAFFYLVGFVVRGGTDNSHPENCLTETYGINSHKMHCGYKLEISTQSFS